MKVSEGQEELIRDLAKKSSHRPMEIEGYGDKVNPLKRKITKAKI